MVKKFNPFLDLNEKDFIQEKQNIDYRSSFINFYIALVQIKVIQYEILQKK